MEVQCFVALTAGGSSGLAVICTSGWQLLFLLLLVACNSMLQRLKLVFVGCRTELMSYETLIFYSVVTSVITLDRVDLKKRVVDAPEILTVIDSIPNLTSFLNSLYKCQYGAFFKVCTVHHYLNTSEMLREADAVVTELHKRMRGCSKTRSVVSTLCVIGA